MKRLLVLLLLLPAAPVPAQQLEVSAVGGFTTSGSIDHGAVGITELELDSGFTWGLSGGYFFSPRFGIEASWTRQDSGLVLGTSAGSAEMFDVDMDRFEGSFVYQFGGSDARLRPFLSAGLGATTFDAPELDAETKLGLGLGAGLRWFPSGRVGARLQARYRPTYLNDASSEFCDPFGFCQSWLHQFEMTGGIVVRF
jgi:hypothetical protein